MPPESVAEGRLFVGGFRAGVDETVADRRVFRPGRDEAPSQEGELATAARGRRTYGRYGLGRGDVVARVTRREVGNTELFGEDFIRLEQCEPAAHRSTSTPANVRLPITSIPSPLSCKMAKAKRADCISPAHTRFYDNREDGA